MKVTELRNKKVDELKDTLLKLKKEQFNLRIQKNSGSLNNTAAISKVRKQIAQIKTVMSENSKE